MTFKKTLNPVNLIVATFLLTTNLTHSQTGITKIFTDHEGFLMSSTTSVKSPDPKSQNLLAFQTGNTVWGTGVNNAALTANGVIFTPLQIKAMPVTVSGLSSGALIGIGRQYGGFNGGTGCSPAVTLPNGNNPLNYLTDGINGLDISTGIFNIGGKASYTVQSINVSSIGDGIPDILITQIGDLSSGTDKFSFKDSQGNVVGIQVDVNFSNVSAVMTPNWKFYKTSDLTCGASSANTRPTRLLAFDFADLGITASNYQSVKMFEHILNAGSDVAFIAYNTTSSVLLPITLTNFNAELIGRDVHISWETASEENSDFYSVEKSNDGISWEEVGNVKAANYSATTLNYELFDRNPFSGISYYRLREVDFNGDFTLSDIVAVNVKEGEISLFPNPAQNIISIRGKSIENFKIFDLAGKQLTDQIPLLNNTETFVCLDIQNLPKGYYLVHINSEIIPFLKD